MNIGDYRASTYTPTTTIAQAATGQTVYCVQVKGPDAYVWWTVDHPLPVDPHRTISVSTAMVLDYAVDRKLLARNVAEQIKAVPRRRRKPDTFTAEEVRQVLDSLTEDRNEHLWHLALRGLRRSEIGGLRWRNIDFAEKTLTIEIGRAAAGGTAIEDEPKTEASKRTLPMDGDLVEVLKRAHRRQAGEKLAVGDAYGTGGYVACDEAGNPYHPHTLSHAWTKAAEAAGVRHIRLHDCRHDHAPSEGPDCRDRGVARAHRCQLHPAHLCPFAGPRPRRCGSDFGGGCDNS